MTSEIDRSKEIILCDDLLQPAKKKESTLWVRLVKIGVAGIAIAGTVALLSALAVGLFALLLNLAVPTLIAGVVSILPSCAIGAALVGIAIARILKVRRQEALQVECMRQQELQKTALHQVNTYHQGNCGVSMINSVAEMEEKAKAVLTFLEEEAQGSQTATIFCGGGGFKEITPYKAFSGKHNLVYDQFLYICRYLQMTDRLGAFYEKAYSVSGQASTLSFFLDSKSDRSCIDRKQAYLVYAKEDLSSFYDGWLESQIDVLPPSGLSEEEIVGWNELVKQLNERIFFQVQGQGYEEPRNSKRRLGILSIPLRPETGSQIKRCLTYLKDKATCIESFVLKKDEVVIHLRDLKVWEAHAAFGDEESNDEDNNI